MNAIVNEVEKNYSDFLTFSRPIDIFTAKSAEDNVDFALTYLRVELVRLRAGMQDFLIRISVPKLGSEKNSIVTIRGNKSLASLEGGKKLASTFINEMKKRNNAAHNWDSVNVEHFAKMLIPQLKFFGINSNVELMHFSTEALA